MKRIIFSVVLGCFVLLVSSNILNAQNYTWSPQRTIMWVSPNSEGIFFRLRGDKFNHNSTCQNKFVIYASDINYNTKVATILTGYSIGSNIGVYYDDDTTNCEVPVERVAVY